jgi:hypothetical protein
MIICLSGLHFIKMEIFRRKVEGVHGGSKLFFRCFTRAGTKLMLEKYDETFPGCVLDES